MEISIRTRARCCASLDGRLNRFQQLPFAKRFPQQRHRTCCHRPSQNGRLAVAGDEDDGNGIARSRHLGQDFPSGKAQHVQIEQHTVRAAVTQSIKKRLARIESFGAEATCSQQPLDSIQD